MGWSETDSVKERRRMIGDYQSRSYSKSELARRYGVTRPTIDLWIERFETEGEPGLLDRSHATHRCPHRSVAAIEELIVATRRANPRWGPVTLRGRLLTRDPTLVLPSTSAIGAMLTRAGLIDPQRRRRAPGAVHGPMPEVTEANDGHNADFKGEHRLGSGELIYPLTITDAHSRVLLCCQGLASTHGAPVRAQWIRVFEEFGLPRWIRTDNGSPFAGNGLWGLSRLAVWWMSLGIRHVLTRPGCPQDNGQHERFHRTLKAETVFPIAATMAEQQARYDAFRADFNTERPHQGIGGARPLDLYHRSPRVYPSVIPEPAYPGHCELRRVSANGTITFRAHVLFLSETLEHQRIALEPIDEDLYSIRFYSFELGRLDARTMQLR
jgi:transposase InsO family protein